MDLSGQTVAYQFTTTVGFDGTTLALDTFKSNEEDQFYEASQLRAGIFPINDPGSSRPQTSRGNRWLTWLELRLESPAGSGALIEIIDNTSGTPIVLKQIDDIAGKSIVYLDDGILIPQGSAVRVEGAGPGVLRYHVTFLDPQGLALLAAIAIATQKKTGPVGSSLEVQDEGTIVVPLTAVMNFVGDGVAATLTGPNTAQIDIPGGALPPVLTKVFLDDTTEDIVVGTTSDGEINVEANISKDNGESAGFRFTFGVSATGVGLDCVQVDSDVPLTDIEPSSALSGTNVLLRLTGSGAGASTGIAYRVLSSLPRLLP
jgi:hypothetical protein